MNNIKSSKSTASHYLMNRKRSLSRNVASPSFTLPCSVQKSVAGVKQRSEEEKKKRRKTISSTNFQPLTPISNNSLSTTKTSKINTPWSQKGLTREERLKLWLISRGKELPKSLKKATTKHLQLEKENLAIFSDIEQKSILITESTACSTTHEVVTKTPGRKVCFAESPMLDDSPVTYAASTVNLCLLQSSAFKRRIRESGKKVVTPVRRSIRISDAAGLPRFLKDDARLIDSPSNLKLEMDDGTVEFLPNTNLRTPLNKGVNTPVTKGVHTPSDVIVTPHNNSLCEDNAELELSFM